ncbi:MAG: long-chain fatty acid--CoA ligase [Xenococcaceae cyanobacterium MO_188.B32]|nr:long-chain fatty acid--CoA ligase [Xenococcaceae cyanobacterium MO_188.B32]
MNKSQKLVNPVDYPSIQSLSAVWQIAAKNFGDTVALDSPHSEPKVSLTYKELYRQIQQFASGLQALGVKSASKVAFFADNSPRWFIADGGIMTAGAANAVRSSKAERQELLYIFEDSDSSSLVIEDLKTLAKLRPELDDLSLDAIVLLSDETPPEDIPHQVVNFEKLMAAGKDRQLQPVEQDKETLATLIYTSGTTGKPKGVMLSHGNLLHQVINFKAVLNANLGDRVLSILPSWHVYERTVEYFFLSRGCTMYYTNIRSFKQDLQKYKPHYMVGVPRLWESLYEGVQKQFREQSASKQKLINFFFNLSENYITAKRIADGLSLEHLDASATERIKARLQASLLAPLHSLGSKIVYQKVRDAVGGNVKLFVSGGGSLAKHLDNFYEIVDIPVLVGYGLTETSPVTNVRRFDRNLRGSAGPTLAETEIKIVDPQTRKSLPQGETGLVFIRGPQVMQGYYKKPEATAKAIDSEGWFDSGDLGWVTAENDLVLTGRAKDTIVLTNGENIEPQPIEDACVRSKYIDQIMLVGQDQKALGALIVPNLEALQQWVTSQKLDLNLPSPDASENEIANSDLNDRAIQDLFRQELNREVKNRPGYRPDDRIGTFQLILEPFSMDNGMMTQSFKIKRPVIRKHYQQLIETMFAEK